MPAPFIDINKDTTLVDIERKLASLQAKQPVSIRIGRNQYKKFFKESWLVSLIANAAVKSGHLTIHDWKNADLKDMKEHFASHLVGILAAYMAEILESNTEKKVTIGVNEILEQIIYKNRGVVEENDGASSKSFSFLSVDSEDDSLSVSRPLVLSASDRNEFVEKFLRIKRERIDKVFGLSNQMSLFDRSYERERDLGELIYELYENTHQHGRYDQQNKLIKGIRSFNLKRHIGAKDALLQQADSFTQLKGYLESFDKNEIKFYEVSISDNGLGILHRFLSSRPDYKQSDLLSGSPIEQLNAIIDRSLSSKLYPGAGKGIRTALSIISELKGFLTLRTNNCWIYYDGKSGNNDHKLLSVNNDNTIADIRGTYYNILLPVTKL